MQLQEKYSDKLVAITLNVDFDGEDDETEPSDKLKEKVGQALASREIGLRNLIATEPMDDVLEKFDLVGLPAAVILGPDGKVVKKFDGLVDYQNEVAPLVGEMVAALGEESKESNSESEPEESSPQSEE